MKGVDMTGNRSNTVAASTVASGGAAKAVYRGGVDTPEKKGENMKKKNAGLLDDTNIILEDKLVGREEVGRRAASSSLPKSILKLLLLLLLVGFGAIISSKKLRWKVIDAIGSSGLLDRGDEDGGGLPAVSMKDILKNVDEFKLSVQNFRNTWNESSPIVKKAFTKFFVPPQDYDQGGPPSDQGGPPPDTGGPPSDIGGPPVDSTLALYNKHIDGMLEAPLPEASDSIGLQQYKINLLLLQGMCNAAAGIMKKLEKLEELYKEQRIPVPILGLGDAPIKLPSLEELLDDEDENGINISEFIKHFGIEIKNKNKNNYGDTNKVSIQIAKPLSSYLRENNILDSCLYTAKHSFSPFLKFHGVNRVQPHLEETLNIDILYSGEKFSIYRFIVASGLLDFAINKEQPPQLSTFLTDTLPRQWCTPRALSILIEQQAYASYLYKSGLERKITYMRTGGPGASTVKPDSLQAILRFLL